MKTIKRIVLTGGGTGGHIYPLIAVAREIQKRMSGKIDITYIGAAGVFRGELESSGIAVREIVSAKLRRYASSKNILEPFRFFISVLQALIHLYVVMPNIIFSKGGPGALPVILAARFYFIPVMIHESDAIPGLTNRISAKFAKRVGISFASAAKYFPDSKIALVGNPIRHLFFENPSSPEEAKQKLDFNLDLPLVLVLGGSQGSARINTFITEHLPYLLHEFQLYHQVGMGNFDTVTEAAGRTLKGNEERLKKRYRVFEYLLLGDLLTAFAAADIVIGRAGSSTIFEIAASGKPSVLIPLPESAQNHQIVNAYEYARSGAAIVIEEKNLTPHLVTFEIKKILEDKELFARMAEAAKRFAKPDAARLLAEEIIRLA